LSPNLCLVTSDGGVGVFTSGHGVFGVLWSKFDWLCLERRALDASLALCWSDCTPRCHEDFLVWALRFCEFVDLLTLVELGFWAGRQWLLFFVLFWLR